jgi:hypothetical protein
MTSQASDASGRSAGHVYVELIGSQLAEERAAKTSLEQRAISGVTWAGGLVAASLGLLATLPDNVASAVAIVVGAGLLATAAVLGTFVISPKDYEEAKLEKLREVVSDPVLMAASQSVAMSRSAEQALDILEAARRVNERKADMLQWELRLLAAGTVALAIAIAAVVVGTA